MRLSGRRKIKTNKINVKAAKKGTNARKKTPNKKPKKVTLLRDESQKKGQSGEFLEVLEVSGFKFMCNQPAKSVTCKKDLIDNCESYVHLISFKKTTPQFEVNDLEIDGFLFRKVIRCKISELDKYILDSSEFPTPFQEEKLSEKNVTENELQKDSDGKTKVKLEETFDLKIKISARLQAKHKENHEESVVHKSNAPEDSKDPSDIDRKEMVETKEPCLLMNTQNQPEQAPEVKSLATKRFTASKKSLPSTPSKKSSSTLSARSKGRSGTKKKEKRSADIGASDKVSAAKSAVQRAPDLLTDEPESSVTGSSRFSLAASNNAKLADQNLIQQHSPTSRKFLLGTQTSRSPSKNTGKKQDRESSECAKWDTSGSESAESVQSSKDSEVVLETEAHSFLAYVSAKLNDTKKYEQFLKLLEGFYTDSLPITSVIQSALEIFEGYSELLQRFKVFLPSDYHADLDVKNKPPATTGPPPTKPASQPPLNSSSPQTDPRVQKTSTGSMLLRYGTDSFGKRFVHSTPVGQPPERTKKPSKDAPAFASAGPGTPLSRLRVEGTNRGTQGPPLFGNSAPRKSEPRGFIGHPNATSPAGASLDRHVSTFSFPRPLTSSDAQFPQKPKSQSRMEFPAGPLQVPSAFPVLPGYPLMQGNKPPIYYRGEGFPAYPFPTSCRVPEHRGGPCKCVPNYPAVRSTFARPFLYDFKPTTAPLPHAQMHLQRPPNSFSTDQKFSTPSITATDILNQKAFSDAQEFVERVRIRFINEPNKYSLFLRCILDLKDSISKNLPMDSPEIIQNVHIVSILLAKEEELIKLFQVFFPHPYQAYQIMSQKGDCLQKSLSQPKPTAVESMPAHGRDYDMRSQLHNFTRFPFQLSAPQGMVGNRNGSSPFPCTKKMKVERDMQCSKHQEPEPKLSPLFGTAVLGSQPMLNAQQIASTSQSQHPPMQS